jgi:hypothetical protein
VKGSSAPIWCGSASSTSASTLHRASALAAETAPTGDLCRWLATLSPEQLIELVLEAASRNLEYRRSLHLRSRVEPLTS